MLTVWIRFEDPAYVVKTGSLNVLGFDKQGSEEFEYFFED